MHSTHPIEGSMAKQTAELSVLGDFSFDEKTINIHPNDGYDIGLMTSSHVVRIFAGCTPQEFADGTGAHVFGTLFLKNECRMGTVEMSLKTAGKLGRTRKARLLLEDGTDSYGKLLIQPA
jgi:hypothetical protein